MARYVIIFEILCRAARLFELHPRYLVKMARMPMKGNGKTGCTMGRENVYTTTAQKWKDSGTVLPRIHPAPVLPQKSDSKSVKALIG